MFCYTYKYNKTLFYFRRRFSDNIEERIIEFNGNILWTAISMEKGGADSRGMVYEAAFFYWAGDIFA